MVEVKKYHLPPTGLIPNSPHPLLHYPGLLSNAADCVPTKVNDLFSSNGWESRWIVRYGQTQAAHYHSGIHECMAVLTGTATIRFGVADREHEGESEKEFEGIELQAQPGDVFVLPAGLAHKTFDTKPVTEFKFLTPGDRQHDLTKDPGNVLENVELSGFTMIGAYPKGGGDWDFAEGGEDTGNYKKVWSVPKPEKDPVLGKAQEGLCGQWE